MNVLIKLQNSPEQRFFVSIRNEDFSSNVKRSIDKGSYGDAIMKIFSKAHFVDKLAEDEKEEDFFDDVELILTEKDAHWNTALTAG